MKFAGLLLCLTFFSSPLLGQNQSKIDSLTRAFESEKVDTMKVKILVDLWRATAYSNPDQALEYAQQVYTFSKEINYTTGIATGLQRIGIVHQYQGDFPKAKKYYKKALAIYEENDSKHLAAIMIFNIGMAESQEGNFDAALEANERSLKIFESLSDTLKMASCYDQFGHINSRMGHYNLALKNLLKALNLFEKFGDKPREADAASNVGKTFVSQGDWGRALQFYERALKIYTDTNDKIYEAHALIDIGEVMIEQGSDELATDNLIPALELGKETKNPLAEILASYFLGVIDKNQRNYKKALTRFNHSLTLSRETGDKANVSAALQAIGETYLDMGQYAVAGDYLDSALNIADSIGVNENRMTIYSTLSEVSEKQRDESTSLKYYKQYAELKDSLFNVEKSRQMAELQTIYETEKKEQTIAIQDQEIELLEQRAEIDRIKQIGLIAGMVAIALFGFLIFMSQRLKMKKNKELREQQRKNEILEREKLKEELAFKKRELTTHALHLIQKNELLESLKVKFKEVKREDLAGEPMTYQRLTQMINNNQRLDKDWENFSMYFQQVHKDFNIKLKSEFTELSNNELRLAALMKMNMSSKEIATLLNISMEGVKKARYRLRKKLNLPSEEGLQDFLIQY